MSQDAVYHRERCDRDITNEDHVIALREVYHRERCDRDITRKGQL